MKGNSNNSDSNEVAAKTFILSEQEREGMQYDKILLDYLYAHSSCVECKS